MKNNKRFLRQRRPDPAAVKAMFEMYANCNPERKEALKKFIQTFDLDLRGAQLATPEEIEQFDKRQTLSRSAFNEWQQLNNPNTMGKTEKEFTNEVNENAKSKFTNEVNEEPLMKFVKLATPGDKIEGFYFGKVSKVKNGNEENECHQLQTTDENGETVTRLLPNNVILSRKLKNLATIRGEKISRGVEVQIEYLGEVRKEGVANKMKDFAVRTAD